MKRINKFIALAALCLPMLAHAVDSRDPRVSLISGAGATTSSGASVSLSANPHRVVATGITTATVTVYGTNVYCNPCTSGSTGATSLGTITTDGGTLDINTGTNYLYGFALVTAWTAGTINVSISPNGTTSGGAVTISSSPNIYADDADFTDGTSVGTLSQCVAEGTASTVTDGDVGACSMTTSRAIRTTVTSGSVSITGGNETEDIAASQTDQALGATGAAGDRFGGFICDVTATTAAATTVEDGASAAFTLIHSGAPAGTYTITNLDWISTSGAWEFTTPANVACKAFGDFT